MLVKPVKLYTTNRAINLDVLCDWIEASILLMDDEELSKIDIADVLEEELICTSQDDAKAKVDEAWGLLKTRFSYIGITPYSIDGMRLQREKEWSDLVAYTFCLLLSLAPTYSGTNGWWTATFRRASITAQGELFEKLTKESFLALFGDKWRVIDTGWSSETALGLANVAQSISDEIGEAILDVSKYSTAKDGGLDLFCFRPFDNDRRVGLPIYMFQCASGNDWKNKLHTPVMTKWKKIINFYNEPIKAFSMPFAISNDTFATSVNEVDGLFLDRLRLLSASKNDPNWLSRDLADQLFAWCKPKVEELVRRSN